MEAGDTGVRADDPGRPEVLAETLGGKKDGEERAGLPRLCEKIGERARGRDSRP